MLELKSVCETCAEPLPGDSEDAWICSFECTFCTVCAEETHLLICPNCGGALARRPPRPKRLLDKHPAAPA